MIRRFAAIVAALLGGAGRGAVRGVSTIRYAIEVTGMPGFLAGTVRTTIDLYGFGIDVHVEKPTPSEVLDLGELVGRR